jgi:hypothetical protein
MLCLLTGQEKPHKDTDTAHSNRTSISQPHSHSQISTPHTATVHGLPSPAINHSGCLPHVTRSTSVIQPTSPKSFDRPDGLPTSPFAHGSEQQGHRETGNVSISGNTGHEQNTVSTRVDCLNPHSRKLASFFKYVNQQCIQYN